MALRERIKQFGLDYVWESAGKQLAQANYCDYGAYLHAKGLLDVYRDHIAACGSNAMDPERTCWSGDPWPFPEDDYIDNVTGREILNALDARPADRPFFLFGSFCGPHKPYDPPASYLEQVPLEEIDNFLPGETVMSAEVKQRLYRVRRAYKAMIGVIDHQVGLLLEKLEREGLLDSTVILFTADHGEMLGDHNRMSKMQPWRQSVTVPTAIRHPEYLNSAQCDAPVELTDLTATILDMAGLDARQALAKAWPAFHDRVPCRSLMPIIRGEAGHIRDIAFSECNGAWQLLQSAQWKYIRYLSARVDEPRREELFDLHADPEEQHNLANQPHVQAVLGQMREARTAILDATPPAQTRWAPFGAAPAM